jgi:sortase A
VGRTLIGLGVLTLLFAAYQLWGTGVWESHSQDALRHDLSGRVQAGPTSSAPPAGPGTAGTAPSSPSTASGRPAPASAPPPEGGAVGIIKIPKIGVDKAIVEGTGTADLRQGPGHYSGTPLPGQPGNAAIAGHRTTYGAPFSNLNELGPGDRILVTTPQGTFGYDVRRSMAVDPSDVSVIAPTPTNELTLTTCTPRFSAAQRLIVQAALVGLPAPAAPIVQSRTTTPGLAGDGESWLPAVGWGLAAAAVALGIWLVARRRRRRWPIYLLGTPVFLAALFMFYTAISNLLPASI